MLQRMKVRSYSISPLAEIDLEEIWVYTVQNWSADQADRYVIDLAAAFAGLADGTRRGRDVGVRAGYLKLPVGSHMVYFRDEGEDIVVIRVLHQRQDAKLHF
jgi:toxin ParE1/3/4